MFPQGLIYNWRPVLTVLWLWLLIFKAKLLKFKNTLFTLKHFALGIEIPGSQYLSRDNGFTKGYLRAQKAGEGLFVLSGWSLPWSSAQRDGPAKAQKAES